MLGNLDNDENERMSVKAKTVSEVCREQRAKHGCCHRTSAGVAMSLVVKPTVVTRFQDPRRLVHSQGGRGRLSVNVARDVECWMPQCLCLRPTCRGLSSCRSVRSGAIVGCTSLLSMSFLLLALLLGLYNAMTAVPLLRRWLLCSNGRASQAHPPDGARFSLTFDGCIAEGMWLLRRYVLTWLSVRFYCLVESAFVIPTVGGWVFKGPGFPRRLWKRYVRILFLEDLPDHYTLAETLFGTWTSVSRLDSRSLR